MRILFKVALRVFVAMVLFIGLFLAFFTVVEYRFEKEEILAIENPIEGQLQFGETIDLMIFNIGFGGLGAAEDFIMDGGVKARPDSQEIVEGYLQGIMNQLDADQRYDFYLFQEVDVRSRRSYNINQMEAIHEYLGDSYSYTYAANFKAMFVPFPMSLTEYIGHVDSGLLTVSRYQVNQAVRVQFDSAFPWPVRTVNLKRAMLVSYVPIAGSDKYLVIANVHLSAYDSDGLMREAEMENLKAFMAYHHEQGNYVIIGGDFNQTFPDANGIYPPKDIVPGGETYIAHVIEDDFLTEGYQFAIDVTLPTCRLLHKPYQRLVEGVPNPVDDLNTQYYIIDGYIVSNNLVVERIETLDHGFAYSDHNPVALRVTLPATGE